MDIYVTYYNNPKNATAEYQKRKGTWYKRKKDSNDPWTKVETKYNKYLNDTFKVKLYSNVRPLYRFGIPAVALLGSYLIYRRFAK